ncbi:MAG: hypothetical protein R3F43_22570 [bacterium]
MALIGIGSVCGLHVADLAIPFVQADRTKFRLVVGGSSPAVLKLFRDIEYKIVGTEAPRIRDVAAQAVTGQLPLGLDSQPQNVRFVGQRERGLEEASVELLERLRQDGEVQYGALWPPLLRAHHIREQDVADAIADLRRQGRVVVTGLAPGKRRVLDEHGVALAMA